MDKENARNTTIFLVCMVALLVFYEIFVIGPREKQRQAQQHAVAAQQQAVAAAAPGAATYVNRAQALAGSPRVQIDTPALQGSVALKGGRLDDLFLKGYRQGLAKDSPPVELFRPEGAKQAYFAESTWVGPALTPGPLTQWTLASGTVLSPGHPIGLTWSNGAGLDFARTIAVDDHYMFTVSDQVTNHGTAPIKLAPYASVQRQGEPELSKTNIIHEGAVGSLGGQLRLIAFKPWKKQGDTTFTSTGGWLGITDKYWLAAIVPDQTAQVKAQFRVDTVNGVNVYEADDVGAIRTLAPGATTTSNTRIFAGAKKVSVLANYEKTLGVPHFDDAVDWGHFWFLTRPIFWLLETIHGYVGNFGIAILLLTVVLRGLMFPFANKSYESMSKMKKLAPEIDIIKKRNDKDPAKVQQETMALYQREKINPLMGCLPVLVQIPIFFSLYKVLYVSLEMRHAPFFGWVQDLSARDPTSFVNLFGLLPFSPASVPMIGGILDGPLHIGVYPILYAATMWLSTAMSSQSITDPTQKMVSQLMPVMLLYFFASTPAGLVVYWVASNLFTVGQQYIIMRRFKVDNPIDSLIAKLRGARTPSAAAG
ncbi:membrane protein insertase YidC [Caulobacter sp. S45]|uniref:membrane protein insertase YidC n=1 Tax=Caulobacter sp. S45 TaxID=1641861 RepID=UPI00131BA843|nr:membrane protein insertase YidC [Caulobacter sp. S45]